MTRKLQRDLETNICRPAKSNPKQFWNNVKGKMKTRTRVSDVIIQSDGNEEMPTKTDQEKAQVLSIIFQQCIHQGIGYIYTNMGRYKRF